MNLYVIAWESKLTGHCGVGTKFMGYHQAKEIIDYYNKKYPGIEHKMG